LPERALPRCNDARKSAAQENSMENSMPRFRPVSLFTGALALLACGGAPTQPPGAAAEAPGAAPAAAAEPAGEAPLPAGGIAWQDMNRDQRIAYMKTTVVPEMGRTFSAFDPKYFPKINCATCHGEGAKKNDFEMPTASLPKLSAAGSFEKHKQSAPEMTEFMLQKVVPQMSALLGEQPYDPATKKGFGCFDCHMPEE
jgi:hypothetical protein